MKNMFREKREHYLKRLTFQIPQSPEEYKAKIMHAFFAGMYDAGVPADKFEESYRRAEESRGRLGHLLSSTPNGPNDALKMFDLRMKLRRAYGAGFKVQEASNALAELDFSRN